MEQSKINANQITGVWTPDNLAAGTNISIEKYVNPNKLSADTVGCWHMDSNKKGIVGADLTGNFAISTTYSKFGGGCGYMSDGMITLPNSILPTASSDFTVDFWFRYIASGSNTSDLWFNNTFHKGTGFHLYLNSSHNIYKVNIHTGYNSYVTTELQTAINASSSFIHIAFQKKGTSLELYIGGNLTATATFESTTYTSWGFSGNQYCHYIDELRFTKSAVYNGNFTPPTEPYSTGTEPDVYLINNTAPEPDLSSYLSNTATGSNSLSILGTGATGTSTITIGKSASGSNYNYCVAVGNSAQALGISAIAIGSQANAIDTSTIAIGGYTFATKPAAIAIGTGNGMGSTASAQHAIQLGEGTNQNAKTFQVYSYQLLDGNTGKIPAARLNKVTYYTGFSGTDYLNAKTACPASYTTAKAYVHSQSAIGLTPSEGNGQVLLSTTDDSGSCVGFAGNGNLIELWNGTTNSRGTYTLTQDKKDYWFLTDILSDGTANLYYIVDGGYTYATLPTDLSQWTLGVSCSNFSLAGKTLQVGRANGNFAPNKSTILDVKVLFDSTLTFDLQNPSHFQEYGNLTHIFDFV